MVIVETIVKFAVGWGLSKAVLYVLGFGPLGPISGSIAAIVQSKSKFQLFNIMKNDSGVMYGPVVSAGSWFAFFQRWGMTGAPTILKLAMGIFIARILSPL